MRKADGCCLCKSEIGNSYTKNIYRYLYNTEITAAERMSWMALTSYKKYILFLSVKKKQSPTRIGKREGFDFALVNISSTIEITSSMTNIQIAEEETNH